MFICLWGIMGIEKQELIPYKGCQQHFVNLIFKGCVPNK